MARKRARGTAARKGREKHARRVAEAEVLDRRIRTRAAREHRSNHDLCTELLRMRREGLWRLLGFKSFGEYVVDSGAVVSSSIAHQMATLAKRLEALPLVSAEFKVGRANWLTVRDIARIATKDTDRTWARAIATCSPQKLQELVREARQTPSIRPCRPTLTSEQQAKLGEFMDLLSQRIGPVSQREAIDVMLDTALEAIRRAPGAVADAPTMETHEERLESSAPTMETHEERLESSASANGTPTTTDVALLAPGSGEPSATLSASVAPGNEAGQTSAAAPEPDLPDSPGAGPTVSGSVTPSIETELPAPAPAPEGTTKAVGVERRSIEPTEQERRALAADPTLTSVPDVVERPAKPA